MLRIWHNPRCSKSREALALLENRGLEPEVFLYLSAPIDAGSLRATLEKLDKRPVEIVRMGQAEWKVTGLSSDSPDDAILRAMVNYPILIERPIVETADCARIGRPPEAVLDIL